MVFIRRIGLLSLFFLICQYPMAQNSNVLGIRLGTQNVQQKSSKTTTSYGNQSSYANLTRNISGELSFLRAIGSKSFVRLRGGIVTYSTKSNGTITSPVHMQTGNASLFNFGLFTALGLGRNLSFNKFIFQYGLDLSFAFSFASHSSSSYDFERKADSSFVRTIVSNHYPGVWGSGLGTFFGLQWNFAPHFFLGLEGRFAFGANFRNVELKRITDTYDREGNLTAHSVHRENQRTVNLTSPWSLSPPAILLNYEF